MHRVITQVDVNEVEEWLVIVRGFGNSSYQIFLQR